MRFRIRNFKKFNVYVLLCQDKVFGAGYPSVPTMSQEEFLEREILEGKVVLDYKEYAISSRCNLYFAFRHMYKTVENLLKLL